MSHSKIRLFIVDDHQSIIDGLMMRFENELGVEVVGFASSKKDLFHQLISHNTYIDIILLDMNLHNDPILSIIETIRKSYPQLKIIAYSTYNTPSLIKRVQEAGVSGYVSKEKGPKELLEAIKAVYADKTYIEVEKPKKSGPGNFKNEDPFQLRNLLSPRETEILKLIVTGKTNREIGEELSIATNTVNTHRRNIKSKTDSKTTVDLIAFSRKIGLID